MKIAITGATGFIGTHLIDRLIADGHEVTAVVRRPAAIPVLRAKGVEARRGDVGNVASLEAPMKGADVVFHLARAKAHGSRPREAFAVNVGGTRNVARAAIAQGVSRFVHCSSAAVYGSRVGTVDEGAPLRPDSAYARSKSEAEHVLFDACGDQAVIARITAVMGPGCLSWLPLFRSAAAGRLRLVGDGSNKVHPADVSDIVDGLIRCALTPGIGGRVFNLAGPDPLSISDLRAIMAHSARGEGASPLHQPRPYPSGVLDFYYHAAGVADRLLGFRAPLIESVSFLTAHRILDLTRARNGLAYTPAVTVKEAAQRTAAWLRRENLLPFVSGNG